MEKIQLNYRGPILFFALLLLAAFYPATVSAFPGVDSKADRIADDLLVLYTFQQGKGTIIADVSGVGDPLNLVIEDSANVEWLPGGGLRVNYGTLVQSVDAAAKVIDACKSTDEISVEAWIRPATTEQDGPARIVTLSANTSRRNFTIGQGRWGGHPKDVIDVRLRTTATDGQGLPSLTTPTGSLSDQPLHLLYTRGADGMARIYINGSRVADSSVKGGFSNWDEGMHLGLSNEMSRDRDWLGDYYLVAIYQRALEAAEVERNFKAWQPEVHRQPDSAVDGPLALYKFEEAGGNTIYDVSGYGDPLDLIIENPDAVSWSTDRGLTVDHRVLIKSDKTALKITDAVRQTNEITVEAWVRPLTAEQNGPARIVTISQNPYRRSFTLGHGSGSSPPHNFYDVRLRAGSTSLNGIPSLTGPHGSLITDLTYVVFTCDRNGETILYIDGVPVVSGFAAGGLSNWDRNMHLALANEMTGDRYWL